MLARRVYSNGSQQVSPDPHSQVERSLARSARKPILAGWLAGHWPKSSPASARHSDHLPARQPTKPPAR